MSATTLHPSRLVKAKKAFVTRRVNITDLYAVITEFERPEAGDLMLARVETIGHHTDLQLENGRRATLHGGDEIIVAIGSRYAPDQFEADIAIDMDQCHLIGAGGLAGRVLCRHEQVGPPTTLTPIGLIMDRDGRRINLRDHALTPAGAFVGIPVLAVLGTSMSAGKTTTATSLIRGLTMAGLRVGAGKVTGAGNGDDLWSFSDAGAHKVLDFTDAGHGSTYRVGGAEIQRVMQTVLSHLANSGSEVVVMEVADGIYQGETAALMRSAAFRDAVDGVLFAASDAVSAVGGARTLAEADLPVIGVSGVITGSPLACRELEDAALVPVFSKQNLCDPAVAAWLAQPVDARRSA